MDELLGSWTYRYTTLTFTRAGTMEGIAGKFVHRMEYRFQNGELEIWVDTGPAARSRSVGRYRLTKNKVGGKDALKFELIDDPEFPRRWAFIAHWWVRSNGSDANSVSANTPR
jgi:hypothetical protein